MDVLSNILMICGCVWLLMSAVAGEDFYELLGINRQANQRDIRKAFKKLALVLHPDKNDEPDANEKFLKINRAYEVLKDEDLRKKYDTYGEDGLKEDGPSGRGFKSWNFYRNDFGIYDDDQEIITLSKSDFETSVEGTSDVWFINFYSPQCGHCHELAPTWRQVARELEGVVRIGAVNCGDDWMLCRRHGIQSYPSLVMFPSKEKYYGDRTRSELVKFCLKQIRAHVHELWLGNFKSVIEDEENNTPWVLSFCGDGGDCLMRSSAIKLAAMLDELASVGEINCHTNPDICGNLGIEYGIYYFPARKVTKGQGMEITSLDAKEIASIVLEQQPDVQQLDTEEFKSALLALESQEEDPWLIHFVEASSHDLELRKLPILLEDINVGRVDCREMRMECDSLYITKFPSFVVFKQGGGHELYHGRMMAHDIAAFARDSANTPVEVLSPADFPGRVVDSSDRWFVDFYAPWCPPCMRLLPEFRKASKHMAHEVQFGTVDCTVHAKLCQDYNVNSYPTTIFYNHSTPHQFRGHHDAHHIIEFLRDTINPPVISITEHNMYELVWQKSHDDIWLIDFFAPWCGPCQQLAPEWRKLAKDLKDHPNIHVAQVDCVAEPTVCQREKVNSYPSIRLYPLGRYNQKYKLYEGWFRDAPSLKSWAFEHLPSKAEDLNWDKFQDDVLRSKEPWIVDFYAPWCGHCKVFAPEFEKVAQAMEGKVHAGKVNCDNHRNLCQHASIGQYPSIRFYKGVKNKEKSQAATGEDLNSQNAQYIINFLNRKLENSKRKQNRKKDEL